MFSYTPNSHVPYPKNPPQPSQSRPRYQYLYQSNLCPRALLDRANLSQSTFVNHAPDVKGPSSERDAGQHLFAEPLQNSSGGYRFVAPKRIQQLSRRQADFDSSQRFSHNIANYDVQQRLQDRLTAANRIKKNLSRSTRMDGQRGFSQSLAQPRSSSSAVAGVGIDSREPRNSFHESLVYGSGGERELQCSCKLYHSHAFMGRPVNKDIVQETHSFVDALISGSKTEESREDNNDDLRNIFWTPSLSFHPYQHGDKKVEFSNLWPSIVELQEHFENSGIQHTVLQDKAVLDLCKIAITCGPVRLLRCLIELQLIRVDQHVENGTGMLHLAVLSRNTEAIQYLTASKISPKLRDKAGNTADQLCCSVAIKKHLPPRYQLHRESRQATEGKMVPKASLQDKDTIFKLAPNPKYFDEIQKKLQTLDFNVNTECDTNGDFLLHIVCRRGLSQLPMVMALVKIQGADVDLCNAQGVTALMLAAEAGNPVLCDVLMCLFGADPNKPNINTGRCALHYAVQVNHRKTVECLIRRGADVNAEDHLGRRPDDVPLCQGTNEDCHEIIQFNRTRRMETLCERIRKAELEKHHLLYTDMFVVDNEGYTLVMLAAIHNKPEAIDLLLQMNKSTMNAQHVKSGMTALAIAAQMGNAEVVDSLLNHGACPVIGDMKSYLPLHHAVLNNREKVVDVMLDYFPQCYKGLYLASRLCKRTSIHVKLKSAFTRRQEEIVTPKLLACAMSGDADELFQLLDDGDNINPKSGTGNWPLYLAVENGNLDVVRLLVERGGDIRKRHSTTGETVLHISAKMGHTGITGYLLAYCRQTYPHVPVHHHPRKLMDINATDTNNRTPLQAAAEKGYSKIVELLLSHGATTALLDADGQLITCPQYEGVRMQIESHRQEHTKDIVSLITSRFKKSFSQLQNIWLPRFDHNLRTRQGDTPLMCACKAGKLQAVKFMLESAVYPLAKVEDDSDEDIDSDSGVLDPVSGKFQSPKQVVKNSDGEEFQASGAFSQSMEAHTNHYIISGDYTPSTDCMRTDSALPNKTGDRFLHATPSDTSSLSVLLHDVSRPKGLHIFHDGLVSHVCAVSLVDGSTALHRAVEYCEGHQLIKPLLMADKACLNIQNDAGLSPLHLACKLGRKKIVEMLVVWEGIDLNVRTLDSLLPEEMTTNKSIIRMVQKARTQCTGLVYPPQMISDRELRDETSSTNSSSKVGSTVNFDKLHSRYEALRDDTRNS